MRRLTIADIIVRGTLMLFLAAAGLLWSCAVVVSFVLDMVL